MKCKEQFYVILYETRMHSNGMRTVRCSSPLLGVGVSAHRSGVHPSWCLSRGVSTCQGCLPTRGVSVHQRGCLPTRRGVCLPGGMSACQGGVCLPDGGCLLRGGVSACRRGVYTSPCGQTDICEKITFLLLLLRTVMRFNSHLV